ncbi:LamG-like jellyroll fold domain-containing protein [bacterium]
MNKTAIVLLLSTVVTGFVFAQIDLDSDLVLHYHFQEIINGSEVVDASPNGINGMIVGDQFASAPGWMGNGLDLIGGEDASTPTYVDAGDSAAYDITDAITLSVWVNQRDCANNTNNPWVGKGDHAYAIKHRGIIDDPDANEFEFFVYVGGGWYSAKSFSDAAYNGFWHHFAGTYDGSVLILYINGEFIATTECTGPINAVTDALNVGRNSQKPDRLYDGLIDEVRIYSRALTVEEIMALYNLPTHIHTMNNLLHSYRLNQNFPNPFNPTTQITYSIPRSDYVSLRVYDLKGREIETLVTQIQSAGEYSVGFNAGNLVSGIYFYKLIVGSEIVETKKMLLTQ